MSPGFWVLLSLDPYVLLGVRNLEEEKKKKARGGVAISPHPPGFMVLPFGPCVFVNGEKEGALGEGEKKRERRRGREGRDLPLVLAQLILFPPSL